MTIGDVKRTSRRRTRIQPVDREGPLPLSFGQQQMWFLNRMEPDSPEYLIPLILRFRGALDQDGVAFAVNQIIERHEVLRTRYTLAGTEPVQVIDDQRPARLIVTDLREDPDGERQALRLAEQDAVAGIDLAREWPLRVRLVRIADEDHLLVAVFHHIACDAWSLRVFAEEFSACYRSAVTGERCALEPLPVQYADFAAHQRTPAAGAEMDRSIKYWRDQLAGLEPIDLPADRQRPQVRSWHGDAVSFRIPAELAVSLREVARAHGVTVFTVLLTAFQTLLARYTGRSDVAVGTVVSGRTSPELQRLIGYGINNLVVRNQWSGNPSFTELIARTQAVLLDAFDHQLVPFARLVDELEPGRDRSRTPLFQVSFITYEPKALGVDVPGARAESLEVPWRTAKFDLSLQVEDVAEGAINAQLEYATALFDRGTVERMSRHLVRLLGHAVASPGTRAGALEILGEDELAVVRDRQQAAEVAVPPDQRTVADVFEAQARAMPEQVAVVCGDVVLSYAELNRRANQLAHHLRELGAAPDTLVGVCLERGADVVVSLLAVLKTGAAYLPLDPSYPAGRLAFMVSDAEARIVVTQTACVRLIPEGVRQRDMVVLERDEPVINGYPVTDPDRLSGADNLIYVIYTSGSTGRPKGVCLTHRNVLRLLGTAQAHYGFGPADVWPLFHSYAFDVSVWELWGALLHGGRLIVMPFSVARSPDDLLDLLVEHQVTVLNQTPSAFMGLVRLAENDDPRIERLNLRAVVFAGEKLEIPELRPWVARLGLRRPVLVNMYGITETTVHSTFYQLDERDLDVAAANPIGRPLGDLRIYLLDGYGALAPVGVPGEIHVGGPGVARGYLNRPALTAERFVPNPYGPPGSRLYRSGDLARRRTDGSLDFLGRVDNQVKIRGYRIELGEVQAALRADPRLRDAVAIVHEDAPGGRRLAAYIVPAGDDTPTTAELRAALSRSLPEYMIPAVFVPVDKIPLTANGKLDWRRLPAPDAAAAASGNEYVAPRTPVEEWVAAAWRDVLGVSRVGLHDSFFDLGGDSIRAVAMVGALRGAGLNIALPDVFECRTVAGLCELAASRLAPTPQLTLIAPFELISAADWARLPAGVTDAYPLSQVQLGMLVEMLADRHLNAYHNITSFRIRDDQPLSTQALQEAARLVVARHEMLRTSIELTGYSVPMQLVHAATQVNVHLADLRGLSEAEQRAALRAYIADQRAHPLDLSTPPLIRVAAHICDGGDWWLSITECHAILEGWSYHSLLMQLLGAYRRLRDGLEPEPFELPAIRYADFIASELRSVAGEEDRAHWSAVVSASPKLSLPTGWGDEAGGPRRVHRIAIRLQDLEVGLRRLAAECRVSLKTMLMTAHLKVMSMLTDEPAFFTGLVCHGRPEAPGTDQVFGLYLNTLPFAFDRSARTWRELAERVFAQEAEMWAHRRFPMPELQREHGDGQRLIDVRFAYLDFPQVDTELVDADASMEMDESPTEFGLAAIVLAGRLLLTSNTEVFSEANLTRLAGMYRAVLEAMVADPDGDTRAAYLPPGERERLLVDWNKNQAQDVPFSVPEQFERQAAVSPEAVALAFEGGSLSYRQLDARANQIAHRLRDLGVGPESAVGVLLDRGPDLVSCLLGVWKAGGAYVPLDPSFPAARVGAMLTDAGARVVLTESHFTERLDRDGPGLTIVDIGDRAISDSPVTAPRIPPDPDRLAYLIFTSGSTGRPKGVQITHRGLGNHVRWAAGLLAAHGTGGAPLFSSVAFDLVVPNLWAPLVTGQPVRLLPPGLDLAELGSCLTAYGPFSFIKLTPGHLEVLGRQLTDEQAAGLASMIVVAGEALSGQLGRDWARRLGPGRLLNEYGPTEASVGTCVFPVPERETELIVPIGRPLPGMTMYVLDAHMEPAPVGVTGELYVGGTGVARGYAGRPRLTADHFLPDPFGPPGGRLYRTGDKAWVRPDGAVCFAGRVDDQAKIRGYRIEPGEIRAVLLEHCQVRDAVVVVTESSSGDRSLTAYFLAAAAGGPTPGELAAHCAQRLPDYMVPAAFVLLESLPLNANGKIDRAALPDPGHASPAGPGGPELTLPRSPLEEQIARIWCDVLDLDRVSVHDSFFDLGGHSIRGVALVGALRAAGLDVGVRDVFEYRTIAELSATLAARIEPADDETVAPFELISAQDRDRLPRDVTDAYPLSQVQRGMLVEMMADRDRNVYHDATSFLVRDDEPFSLPALRQATAVVTGRHEMLRTSMDLTTYSVPMQLVHATAEIPVSMIDLRGLDADEQRAAVRRLNQRERAMPFDMSRAPLLRLTAVVQGGHDWRLTFTQLHAITEGWSFHSLLMELLDCYRRIRDGQELAPSEAPSVRYADFIAAELRSLESAEDRAYWQKVVTGYPKLTLPTAWAGDPRQPREDYHLVLVYEDLQEGLRALASAAKASLKSVLHAAHLKVMSMITPEPAFASGLVLSARPQAEGADRVYGMYLNTVPFGFDRTARTWLELVTQTFAGETELLPYRRFPLSAIQREIGDGGRLLDVLYTYQDFNQVDTELVEMDATEGVASTEFALNVPCNPRFLALLSNTHAISRASAHRLLGMYRAVLEAMAADPRGDARASYLPPGEEELIKAACGGTRSRPVTRCLHQVFEERAAASPDAVAVVSGSSALSYAQLNARANQIAHLLRARGVGPENLVGVALEPGLDLLPALLGVLKAGGAYLPLPLPAPAERLHFVCRDTGAAIVLTHGEHLALLADCCEGELIALDSDEDLIAKSPSTDPAPVAGPASLAYVIYTSGSTGRPKGVAVTHANVLRMFEALADRIGSGPDQAWALLHSYAFDVSVWEMWGALLHGGRVVVVPPATAQAPDDLLNLLEDQQVTTVSLSPVAFRALVGAANGDGARLSRLALRDVMFGGDRLEAADLADWLASQGRERARLAQGYGPTEATVHVTYHVIDAEDLTAAAGIPIGQPLDDVRVYVLDADGRPVPVGVPGELCAGGGGLARGYVNRPSLTASLFVPDPYGPPGTRYYRTGDVVRRRADGNLDFLGRVDDQIKVRGYRVEPGEVQAVLTGHPGVREAVVIATEDGEGGRRLVAYYVPAGAGPVPKTELAAHCAVRLPDYMIPAAFVLLDRIPLTGNGKLDQRGLPALDRSSLWMTKEYVAPRTDTERTLTEIWCRLLNLARVGVHDRFFDLGGDSLMVLRALTEAREAGLAVSLRKLYQYASIADLAEAIDRASAVLAGHGAGGRELRLTPTQHMVLDRDAAGRPGHYQVRLRMDHWMDAETLGAALDAVIAHHDALRLRVASDDRGWHGTVAAADVATRVRQVNADEPAGADTSARTPPVLAHRAATEAGQRLNITDGPVLDVVLVPPDNGQPAQLVIAAHELAVDRASWPVLLEDLETACGHLAGGRAVVLPPASDEFGRWTGQLAGMATGELLTSQAHYWLNLVPGPPLPLRDGSASTGLVGSSRTITAPLPAGLARTLLRQVPTDRLRELMLAAAAAVLARWAGGDRLLVDVEARPERGAFEGPDLSRAVGPFTHRFPVALWLPPRREAHAVLRSVTEQLRSVPDDGLGYGMLRYLAADADLAGALDRMPRPQVRFGFAQSPVHVAGAGSREREEFTLEDLMTIRDPVAVREHLMEIDVLAGTAEVRSSWTYSPAMHDEATIRGLMAQYVTELAAMAGSQRGTGSASPSASPRALMSEHHVPGVSLATIRGGELVSVDAYGQTDARGSDPVTSDTLFRVASVSKQITALAVLRLATEGRLDLDEDVNSYLVSWRMPDTGGSPVTARHLLANVAGLTTEPDHEPYRPGAPVPTTLEALAGRPPALTPGVRPKCPPGQLFEKNRNNYLVLDQLMADITGMPFPRLMRELVFNPLSMTSSSFDPSCPATAGRPVARGHDAFGVPVNELGPTHPAIAAGGLWTTAKDLARAELEIRRAYLGQPALITRLLASEMLTPTPGTLYGLSTVVDFLPGDVDFGIVGEFTGYFAVAMCGTSSGDGFVLLTNADGGRDIARFIAGSAGERGQFGRIEETRRVVTVTEAGQEA